MLVYNSMDSVLFDMCSTYSYESVKFKLGLDFICDILDSLVHVSTLDRKSLVVTHVYHSFFVMFIGLQTLVDFFILYMLDFDVILGITWLFIYHVVFELKF